MSQQDDFVKVLYMFPLMVCLLFFSLPSGLAVSASENASIQVSWFNLYIICLYNEMFGIKTSTSI